MKFLMLIKSIFSATHKFGNVGIFVLLKFELSTELSPIYFHSKMSTRSPLCITRKSQIGWTDFFLLLCMTKSYFFNLPISVTKTSNTRRLQIFVEEEILNQHNGYYQLHNVQSISAFQSLIFHAIPLSIVQDTNTIGKPQWLEQILVTYIMGINHCIYLRSFGVYFDRFTETFFQYVFDTTETLLLSLIYLKKWLYLLTELLIIWSLFLKTKCP